ncbi:hypothetical protein HPB51_027615 [Rhipicephalus microplus]|uniref:Ribonuclease P protein subunit p20 n=1 Tax=Rhipicephalus microplus TaxID=6941 RepID=A0A9J6CZR9_RHIMP|nr:hypothetical protein HPB51_027615 [Rhipicephalus microplus]
MRALSKEAYAVSCNGRSRGSQRTTRRHSEAQVRPGRVSDAKSARPRRASYPVGRMTSGKTEVFVHAMGAAVGRAINLALQVEANYQGLLEMDVRTSTVGVVDDLEPLADDLEPTTQTRQTSAVHIRLFMPNVQKQE